MFKRLLEFFKRIGKKGDAESPDEGMPGRKTSSVGKKAAPGNGSADKAEGRKPKKRRKKPADGEPDAAGKPVRRKKRKAVPVDSDEKPRKKKRRKKVEAEPGVTKKRRTAAAGEPEASAPDKASASDKEAEARKSAAKKAALKKAALKKAAARKRAAREAADPKSPSRKSADEKGRPVSASGAGDALPDLPDLPDDDLLLKKKKAVAAKKAAAEKKAALKGRKKKKNMTAPVSGDMDVKVVKGLKKKKKKLPKPGDVPEDMDVKVAKGKKKKKKKVPPPVADLSGDSDFNVSFKADTEQHSDRKAYRVSGRGMSVRLKGVDIPCPLRDLSVTGLGFDLKKPKLKRGNIIAFEILDKKGDSLGMVKAEVMRHFEGLVGCCFKNLDSMVEDRLHKIVLNAQKKPEGKGKSVDLNLDL